MTLAERINAWLVRWRQAARAAVVSRALILLAGSVALVVSGSASWDQADIVPIVALPLLVLTILHADSPFGLGFIGVLVAGWISRAPAQPSAAAVLVALCLVGVHVGAAWAAQLPLTAPVSLRHARRWLLPTTIALAAAPVVALTSSAVLEARRAGALAVTVTAIALVTAAIWYAAVTSRPSDPQG